MKQHKLSTSIVIPNWNGRELLERNLHEVLQASGDDVEIVLVDDGSTDESIRFVKTHFPAVIVVQKGKHEGFASAVNAGVVKATGEVIVLLNTDVVPQKDFLRNLTKHFADNTVFAVGCLEKSYENNGKVVLRGRGEAAWEKGFFVHWKGEVNAFDTAWVAGGSGAFRKSIWHLLGGMDTLYNPFYWEDIDLSYRALKAGYRLIFEPGSVVSHYHQMGKIRQKYKPWYVKTVAYRNQYMFIWKNLTSIHILLDHFLWLPVRIFQGALRMDVPMMFGFLWAVTKLPQILYVRNKLRVVVKIDDELFARYEKET